MIALRSLKISSSRLPLFNRVRLAMKAFARQGTSKVFLGPPPYTWYLLGWVMTKDHATAHLMQTGQDTQDGTAPSLCNAPALKLQLSHSITEPAVVKVVADGPDKTRNQGHRSPTA